MIESCCLINHLDFGLVQAHFWIRKYCLGVSESALRKWVRAEEGGNQNNNSITGNALTLSEHDELLRLRKENIKLKMEREILKKAAAFFAQEQR